MRLRILLFTFLLPLTACMQSPAPSEEIGMPMPPPPFDLGEVYPAYTSENGVLTLPPLNLRISHPVSLSTTPSYGENFDVTGTGTQTFFVYRVVYGELSQGLADWQISESVVKHLQTDQACILLGNAGSGVYLPVKTDRPMQCGAFTNSDGQRVIAAAGYADVPQGLDYPASMLIIPRDNDAIILYDLVAFPEFTAWFEAETKMFEQQYPADNPWIPSTPEAAAFHQRVTDYLGRSISQPSEEVAKNMNELEAWTQRVTLY